LAGQTMTPDAQSPASRLVRVQDRIRRACARAGRDPGEVTLVAVSKTKPAAAVADLHKCGQRLFGESYVQEALDKIESLAGLDITWHFMGRLQKNKAKFIPGRFALVHTLDSLELAHMLHRKAEDLGLVQDVLLQVNLAAEPQKAGCDQKDLPALAEAVLGLPGLKLQGLMILPPWDQDPEKSRPWFAGLRRVRDELAAAVGAPLAQLSMGMSHDLEQAVEEGATLVRVGTDLFGERTP